MELSKKIKSLRAERGWTQAELAKRSQLDRGYIANLEIGGVGKPSGEVFLKLARAFGIRPDELYQAAGYIKEDRLSFQHQETPEEILERLRVAISSTVPVYQDFAFHAGESMEPADYVSIMKDRSRGRNLEGYIARGNCLEPHINDGDIIIVDRDGEIDTGNIVACLVDGMLYLAQLRKIGDELYLENNDGRIKLEDCQVAAPVIEVRRRLK